MKNPVLQFGVIALILALVAVNLNTTNAFTIAQTMAATGYASLTPTSTYVACPAGTPAATLNSTSAATPAATLFATAASNVTPVVHPGFIGVVIRQVEACGVRIIGLRDDGTARRAGLNVDDVIVRIDGQPVTTVAAVRAILSQHQPGDSLVFTIQRNGVQMEIKVLLGVMVDSSTSQPNANVPLTGTETAVQ
jgi:S1-C subfamily serine protease